MAFLNCSLYDDKCFEILGSLKPAQQCINGSSSQDSPPPFLILSNPSSAIFLWLLVMLLLLQSLRTAVSISSRLPKSDEISPIQHLIVCVRQHSDFRLCIFAFFASFLLAISRIISFSKRAFSNDGALEPFWRDDSMAKDNSLFRVFDATSSALFDVSFLMISRRILTRDKNQPLLYANRRSHSEYL
jgi:hypothetical protein